MKNTHEEEENLYYRVYSFCLSCKAILARCCKTNEIKLKTVLIYKNALIFLLKTKKLQQNLIPQIFSRNFQIKPTLLVACRIAYECSGRR